VTESLKYQLQEKYLQVESQGAAGEGAEMSPTIHEAEHF
jgi:hypothetical protein